MATQAFTLSGQGAQSSATIAIASGEKVRVRFSQVTGFPDLQLVVTANSVTTYYPIDDRTAWVSDAVLASDAVGVRMVGAAATDMAVGIIESGT